jgi:hypothetical protein
MNVISGMPGNRHASGFDGMLVLAMTATRRYEPPTIEFDLLDQIANFHW